MMTVLETPEGPTMIETFRVNPDFPRRSQTIEISTSPGAKSIDVKLAPWQTIEVVVSGAIQEFTGAQLRLSLCEAAETVQESNRFHKVIDNFREQMPLPDGRRRFVVTTGPGRFVIDTRSSLVHVPLTSIEVGTSATPPRIELVSTR